MISEAYIQETGKIPQEKMSKKRKHIATKTHWDCTGCQKEVHRGRGDEGLPRAY